MSFKFIHVADVHLDTPFKNRDKNIRAMLRECQRFALKSSFDLAIENKADAVLIAGDLFDNDTLSFATEKFLLKEMDRLHEAGIRVLYAPGNHDPYGSSFRLSNLTFPPNVHVFMSSRPESYNIYGSDGKVKAVVAGAGHQGKREDKNLASYFPKASGSVPYVGLLHTFVTGLQNASSHDRYAPCTMQDLVDKGYSYWALGHIHTRCELSSDPYIVYPGNIIGRNHGEEGPKGVYIVNIDDDGVVGASFRQLSDVCWETVKVKNLTEVNDLAGLERELYIKASECISRESPDSKLFLRLEIEGPCSLYNELKNEEDMVYLSDSLKSSLNVEDLEIAADMVTKPIDIDEYRGGPHIMGAVLDLIDRLNEDDELLLKLSPKELAGLKGADDEERLNYLKGLLCGLDYEAAIRLIREDAK